MAKNVFFDIAVKKASGILGKKGRLVMLVSKLALKLRSVNWKEVKTTDVKDKFFTLGRLLKAYALGHYREIPWKPLLLITAAVIYFINPIDFLPDWIPGAGLTDDVGILMSVFASFGAEINKFILWEKSQLSPA
ncbi:MAG TPA: DUF1232 domain-containing protein [Ohtaekwangia sp.]|uniref:YkvA family protein n=1 Tax=Ohtaekwangia sp. TaxID=2066019 RepID=UPI002F931772